MGYAQTTAELRTQQARIHIYTYRYERPSNHTRHPERDVLALFDTPPRGAAAFFRKADFRSSLMPLGDLMLIPAGTSVSAMGDGGEHRLAVCTMTRGILPEDFDITDQRHLALCSDIRDAQVRGGMRRLAQEAAAPGFAADILVDGLVRTLQIDLARYLMTVARRPAAATGTLAPGKGSPCASPISPSRPASAPAIWCAPSSAARGAPCTSSSRMSGWSGRARCWARRRCP